MLSLWCGSRVLTAYRWSSPGDVVDRACGQTQKATSHPVFQSLEVWISSEVYEREVRMKTMQHVSRQTEVHAGKTCAGQLLPTHIQRKKLKFSETALRFAVKVKLSTYVCNFFCKIMAGTAHASCVWPLCAMRSTMTVYDWCISILAVVVCDWGISIAIV